MLAGACGFLPSKIGAFTETLTVNSRTRGLDKELVRASNVYTAEGVSRPFHDRTIVLAAVQAQASLGLTAERALRPFTSRLAVRRRHGAAAFSRCRRTSGTIAARAPAVEP